MLFRPFAGFGSHCFPEDLSGWERRHKRIPGMVQLCHPDPQVESPNGANPKGFSVRTERSDNLLESPLWPGKMNLNEGILFYAQSMIPFSLSGERSNCPIQRNPQPGMNLQTFRSNVI